MPKKNSVITEYLADLKSVGLGDSRLAKRLRRYEGMLEGRIPRPLEDPERLQEGIDLFKRLLDDMEKGKES